VPGGHIYVREDIDGRAETVWQLIRDFGDISAWARGKVVRIEGMGIGMVRYVEGAAGCVVERCEAHDEAAMTFTYRLLESPWPFTNVVTVKLTASAPGKTTVEWSSRFETDADHVEDIRAEIESAFRNRFISRLREAVVYL
jgi:hypothetical protein